MTKVFLFGIDGSAPELLFKEWIDELPNIRKLMQNGSYARLNSTIPPSTIVAWNAMVSGRDTSEIGIFSYTYLDKNGNSRLVNSRHIKCRLIWDILGKKGKKSIALYVPLTYPVKPINGVMVSDFMTPGINSECAYPAEIKEKIKALGDTEIFFDVAVGLAGHKGMGIDDLIEKTYKMTEMQLRLLKDLLKNGKWDFFMAVMIGTDRLQHMLWRHFDSSHRRFIKDSPYKDALKKYYIYLDKNLGEILEMLDKDTVVIVASDHGMVKQEGKININNWLIKEGYLVLKEGAKKEIEERGGRFKLEWIDFSKTIAYGGGAYNARVYINKEIAGKNYNRIRDEIEKKLLDIKDDKGNKIDTKIYKAEEIYKDTASKECPDLTIYFDDLRWASNPDLGQNGLYSWESAIGADSAGHSRQGCFIISGKDIPKKGIIGEIDIMQVMPTILKIMGMKIPEDVKAEPIKEVV
jgi:predicted AlkP superfamily phosphohydrolase/phosphomutase